MDSRLVSEGVRADDGLVRLHRETGDGRHQARGAHDVFGADSGAVGKEVGTGADRHDDLFHRRVARAFAEAVDGAFDLARPGPDGGERVRHRQTEVVVAMHGQRGLVDVRHAVTQHGDERREFVGRRIAHRIGDVDRARAGLDRAFDRPAEEVGVGARAVLRTPFDIVAQVAREGHAVDHRPMHVVGRHAELVLHVQRTGRNEGVDALAPGGRERLGGAFDILAPRTRERAHDGFGDDLRDLGNRLEVAVRGDGEPGFDDVHAHRFKDAGDFDLLLERHGRARRLLAVTHGGVEDPHMVAIIDFGHRTTLPWRKAGFPCERPERAARTRSGAPKSPSSSARTRAAADASPPAVSTIIRVSHVPISLHHPPTTP